MSDLFSSAWSYLRGGGDGGGDGGGGARLVGQEVDMGGGKVVKIRKTIAEGGYGYVFVAQDTQSGKEYALKRQVVAKENVKVVKQEIAFLRQLRGHPHIIQLTAASGSPPSHTSHGNAEFVILTELCSGGKLEDIVNKVRLAPRHVLHVFYETCSAVAHMHSQTPPIVHRDLKVENLLLTAKGSIKLCDFGSATTQHLSPDYSWTATQRGLADEEIQRNTTPMYRAPEMIDLYSNHPINEKADIWALGCLLYKLCYQEHPFEDSAKLRILSANYKLPADDTTYTMFHSIIRSCLQADPSNRPSVDSIVAQLYGLADQLNENINQPSMELLSLTSSAPRTVSDQSTSPYKVEGDGGNPHTALQSTSQQAHRLFGFMKDGAGNLFKKLRDSSSTVVQQVTSAAQGSRKPPLDIAYITSRILAMSFPHEDTHHANSLQEVREFLETRHPSQYLVFNLSGHSYDTAQLNNQVADFAWPHRRMPDMEKLVDLCRNLDSWLRADRENIIVLHCHDGRLTTALVVTAYLLFLNAFSSPLIPLRLFTFKRSFDIQPISASPSQLRYLQYILDLVGDRAYKPHSNSVTIKAIQMSSVPLFNAIKTGCKPFVEVFQDGERMFTSASQDTMQHIQSFTAEHGGVVVPLGTKVRGNIQVIIHHIRAIPIARKANLGMTAVRMFQFQFHTGFIPLSSPSLTLERQELDGIVAKKENKFPSPFRVLLGLEWDPSEQPHSPGVSWQHLPHPTTSPLPAFSSLLEQEETMKQFYDLDETLIANQQPDVAFHLPYSQQQQHLLEEEEDDMGVGTEERNSDTAEEGQRAEFRGPPPQSAKAFFSQLDWRGVGGDTGYTAYETDSDSDDSSSSSEEDEMINDTSGGAGLRQPQLNHKAPHANGGSVTANVSASSGGPRPPPSTAATGSATLIQFGGDSDDEEQETQTLSVHRAPPTTSASPPAPQKSVFGDFDPWGSTSTAQTMNLLNLEDKLTPPSDSEQSEARTAGTEAFNKKSQSLRSSPSSNQFDPFATDSNGGLGEMFGNPGAFMHSSSSENLPTHNSAQQSDFFSSNFLTPSPTGTNSIPHRHSSAPNVAALGNPSFAPTLSGIAQAPKPNVQASHAGSKPTQQMHSQMAGNYNSATSGGRTSPYGAHLMTGSSSPLGFHAYSTGHIQQQQQPMVGKGRGMGGMQGNNRDDPFADLGNVKLGSGGGPKLSKPQAAPQGSSPMANRPSYQHYSQQPTHAQPKQHQPSPASRQRSAYQPNYSSSVLGDHSRSKTGVPQPLKVDDFSDLLNVQGFSKPDKGPRTLKDMKKDSDIEGAIDPDRARVRAWAEGKERNIRALISSLHTIIWEGETRWKGCGMHQLVHPDQVKKMYRKACLSVHPDKAQDTEHENLARAIFDELNDAYAQFEESGAQPLY